MDSLKKKKKIVCAKIMINNNILFVINTNKRKECEKLNTNIGKNCLQNVFKMWQIVRICMIFDISIPLFKIEIF